MSKKCEEGSKKGASKEKANFVCKKCGASSSDKNHLCKPQKAKK